MSTTTAPDIDAEVLLLAQLEQDHVIACEFAPPPSDIECGRPASHWVVCRACRTPMAECDRCLALADALWFADRRASVQCEACGSWASAPRWRDLFEIVPLHLGSA